MKNNDIEFEDLTGRKFYKLKVIRKVDDRQNKSAVYECKCDCGNTTYVPGYRLLDENTKSCGCLYKERFVNLEGRTFKHLTVLKRTDKRFRTYAIYECKCDCGNIVEYTSRELIKGFATSCGCKKNKNLGKHGEDLTGKKFDKLKVIRPTEKRINNYVVWECQCECGNTVFVSSYKLKTKLNLNCGCVSDRTNYYKKFSLKY